MLEDILITEQLESRNSRRANFQAENQALRRLLRQLVQKETLLQNVVDVALELCQAQTAGVSLLEMTPSGEEVFRWNVIAGTLKQHVGAITPRNFSPCGICDDRGTPQLFSYPERYFTYLQAADTPIVEELVLPLIADNHVFGTIWIKSHDQTRHFDSEDVRLMTSLAEFTTTALSLNQLNQLNQPQTQKLPALNASGLREFSQLSRALIENLPGGAAFVVDHDLRYLLAEGEALSQAGFKPEDLIGHTIFEVLPPELAASYEVLYRQALAGELFEHEHNAHGRSYISRGMPLREENGEVYAALAISYDISDRKQAENALRESSERLRLATEVAQIYSWEFDLKTQTPKFSANFERITGRAPSQSFVENLQFVYPEDRASVIEAFERAINNDNTFDYEMRAFNGDNQINWYRVSGVIIRDANDEPIRAVGISQNITDSKQALSALRQSEQRLQTAQKAGNVGVWDWDAASGKTYWSETMWTLYGYESQPDKTGDEIWESSQHPEDQQRVKESLAQFLASNEIDYRGEFRIIQPNGSVRWIETVTQLIRDATGKPVRMSGVNLDITDRKQASAALAHSRRQFEKIAATTPDLVYVFDLVEERNIFVNAGIDRVLGYSQAQIATLGSSLIESLIHPDDIPGVIEGNQRFRNLGDQEVYDHELRMRHATGEYRWLRCRDAVFERAADGTVTQTIGTAQDITDRKRAETALRESEARQAFLLRVSDVLRSLADPVDIQEAVTQTAMNYFGADRCYYCEIEDDIAIIWRDAAREDLPSVAGVYPLSRFAIFKAVVDAGRPFIVHDVHTTDLVNEDLRQLCIQLQVISFVDVPVIKNGKPVGILCLVQSTPRDWTDLEVELVVETADRTWAAVERARAEAALRESERKLQSAIAVAQLSPYEWNPMTGSLKWDARLKAMWGLPADAQINYEIYNAGIHPQDREYVERQVEEAIDPNGDGIFEAEFRTIGIEDKIERWVSVRGQTFFDGQGHPVHYVGAAQDVTERKQALSDRIQLIQEQTAREEEHQRAEALAQLDRAKTMFFSNVSHEFRTPLTLLLAPLFDVLSDCTNPLAPPQRERLEIAHRNAIRLLKLVNTLLDFSRIEAGRIEAVYEPTDLAMFTTELASVFRSAIEQVGLKLIVDCLPLPPVYVDREMWEKIVLNLLSNAFKFTLEGEIIVRLHQYNDDYVTLQVQDTGAGIPASELPHIFERFYHVRTTHARTHEGTGIGLALVQELIKMHGGTVEVSSVVGQGSCFTVKIPLGTAHLPSNHIKASSCRDVIHHVSSSVEIEERRHSFTRTDINHTDAINQDAINRVSTFILLVDDNADMRDYLKRILSEHVQVEAVADGAAAMAIISERVADLVLSDVMMPHLDGFGLLKALRADPRTKEVPIILLSARAGEESVIEGLQAGADDYLIKPFSATSLVTRVLAHLQLAQLRAEALHHQKISNRMKDKLLAEVSHELQAPLVSILGWTRLLRSSPSNQSILVRALETIERNANLQAKLIQDLLDISRITSGKISLNKAPVELQSVIESALATVHQAQKAKDICLECIFNPKSITVEGDTDRLQQIILNLLTNAIKFTPEGGRIEVRLDVIENQAQIEVRDTGIGIEPEFLPYVFETFRQSKNSKTGLGLGLAIARQLVQLHGGALSAESSGIGQGATFTIKLPLINVNL